MNILHLVNSETTVGAITSIKKITNALDKEKDFNIKLLCYNSDNISGVDKNIELIFINLNFTNLFQRYTNNKIGFFSFFFLIFYTFFSDLFKLQKLVIKHKISIVHTHYLIDNFLCSFLFFTKKISHIRSIPNTKFLFGLGFKFFKFFIKYNSTAIIGISETVLKDFRPLNSKFNVIYNGYEIKEKYDYVLSNFQKEKLAEIKKLKDEGYFVVGSISRFNENKGLQLFLNIAKETMDPNIKFVIVAPINTSSEREYFEKLQINNYKNVIYIGSFPNSCFVLEYYNILIQPTIGREGFGNVILEAQNFGLPVLSTNCGGPSEIITIHTGYIIDKENINEFVSQIYSLKNNKLLYDKFSKKAFLNSRDFKFKFENTISSLINLYKKI